MTRFHTIRSGKVLGLWCRCGATFGKDSSLALEHLEVLEVLDGLDPSTSATENADVTAVREAMHAERAEKDTRRVDCWACEAAQSEAVGILLGELRKTQALLAQAQDVFDIAVPNSEDQRAAWRRLFQQRLDELDAGQSTQTVTSEDPSDH